MSADPKGLYSNGIYKVIIINAALVKIDKINPTATNISRSIVVCLNSNNGINKNGILNDALKNFSH